jgi:hypothetical protein
MGVIPEDVSLGGTMSPSHLASVIFALCGLSACGGASTGTSEFEQFASQGATLADRFESAELTEMMPASGTASYTGMAAFAFDPSSASLGSADVAARLTLQADFSGQTIGGQLTDFLDLEDVRYSGSVNLLNGVITGNEFAANVDGALTRPSGSTSVTGQMVGAFVGSGAEASAGLVEATAFGSPFVGVFIAERQ